MSDLLINDKYLSDLRKLQLLELKIAKEIKRICEVNRIQYFLIGGTLLGAVRHEGFIPWDDDMDIGMTRKNYEKFIEVCSSDLGSEFFLQTYETDNAYGNFFAKIRLQGTHFIEKTATNVKANDGIYVDIFPFDFVPKNEITRKSFISKINKLTNLYRFKKGYKIWKEDFIHIVYYYICKFYVLFISKDKIEKSVKSIINSGFDSTYPLLINYFDCTKNKEFLTIDGLNELLSVNFEDTTFNIPSDSKDYLSRTYGDYLKLPPEDERYDRHSIVNLDFGNY